MKRGKSTVPRKKRKDVGLKRGKHSMSHRKSILASVKNSEKVKNKWEARLQDLKKYKQEHGDCLVPYISGRLGRWVSVQR